MLVLVHEFGHFFSAKKFGIRVDEFGFGFPPKLFSVKKGETEYSLNALPFGGFVKIFGENFDEADFVEVGFLEKDLQTKQDFSRSFVHQTKWKQAIVLFAGVFANFLLAWFLFSIGFMSGLPASVGSGINYKLQDVNLMIISVLNDSPAYFSGLKSGDKIISVRSLPTRQTDLPEILNEINPDTLKSFIILRSEKEIEIGYLRSKEKNIRIAEVIPVQKSTNEEPMIGVSMDMIGTAKLPVFSALKEGMLLTLFVTKSTVLGLFTLISEGIRGKGGFDSITGPVGMVGIVGAAYQFGFVYLLSFTALISVNLAIINLLPFPALDGGRLFFLLIEKIKGSRMNPKFVNTTNIIGFGILVLFMLVITYNDVMKLF